MFFILIHDKMVNEKSEETSLDFSCLAGIMNINGFNFVLKWINTYLEDKVLIIIKE